jgi:hypothetical protein
MIAFLSYKGKALTASAAIGRAVFHAAYRSRARAFCREETMNPKCPICFGIGWVCEAHPDRAWDGELGCTSGAGEPCQCRRTASMSLTSVSHR